VKQIVQDGSTNRSESFKLPNIHDDLVVKAFAVSIGVEEDRVRTVFGYVEIAISNIVAEMVGGYRPDSIFIVQEMDEGKAGLFSGNRERMRLMLIEDRWLDPDCTGDLLLRKEAPLGSAWIVIGWRIGSVSVMLAPLERETSA
jgi:hypothetical protein